MTLESALRELAYSEAMEPVLIQFDDDAELKVVARPTLTDISWCYRGREYQELISRSALLDTWAENGDPSEIEDMGYAPIAEAMLRW